MIAQYLGAFLGAALVFFTYKVIVCKIFFFCFWLFCNYIFLTSIQFKEWKILKLTTTGCNWYVHWFCWGLSGFFSFVVFFCVGFFRSAQDFEQVDGENATAGIFVTFPGPGISNFNGAVDQVFCSFLVWQVTSSTLLAFFPSFNQRWLVLLCCFLPSAPSTIRQTLPSPPGIATLFLATIWRWISPIWFEICFPPALVHSW